MTGDDVVGEARKWIGTRYRNQGRSERGIDCLGLLVMVGRTFNVPHTDEPSYSVAPSADHLILKRLAQYLDRLPYSTAPAVGTIGVFAEARLPGHVGFFSRKHGVVHLIHARLIPARVVEESWHAIAHDTLRLIALFGFPGLET
jgi:cell wall-associated NlpC family hydrolase